jgi:germination protein M
LRRVRRIALVFVVALVAAGCGGGDDAQTTTTVTTTAPAETTAFRVYFLRDGKVWPVSRKVEKTEAVARAALDELVKGPTDQEADDLGMTSAIPQGTEVDDVSIESGVATVDLSAELPEEALAQAVYTLTQFSTVESVQTQGRRQTRGDFEDVTPTILVESPLPFEEVTSPLHASGTANTFEATFNYEVTDTDGKIVETDFVTATSGTGTRGTFDFIAPFTVPFDGVGELIVFELSAKDGSRIHLVEIPLRMKKAE